MLLLALLTLASNVWFISCGMMVAARMPRMMTTTMISTRVKARDFLESEFNFIGSCQGSMHGPAHPENGQQQRDDHEADHGADDQDQDRAEQGDQGLDARAHVPL